MKIKFVILGIKKNNLYICKNFKDGNNGEIFRSKIN